jgi:hypothetical protein
MSSQLALTFSIVGKQVLTYLRIRSFDLTRIVLQAIMWTHPEALHSRTHPHSQDAPLYEYVINARQGAHGVVSDTAHMFQFIVHASLDV